MINRMLRCPGLPFLERDHITYLSDSGYENLSCNDNSWLTWSDCYVASKVPLLVFDSSDSKEVAILEVCSTWPPDIDFMLLTSFRLSSISMMTALLIIPHLKAAIKTAL